MIPEDEERRSSEPIPRRDLSPETFEARDEPATSLAQGLGPEADNAGSPEPAGLGTAFKPPSHDALPTPARSSGLLSTLLGLAALVLLASLVYVLYEQPGEGRVAGLDQRLSALDARIASLEARPVVPSDAATVRQRLDSADQKLAALTASVAAIPAPVKSDPGVPAAEVAALDGKVADVARQVEELRAAVSTSSAKIEDTGKALGAMHAQVEALPVVDLTPLTGRLDALDARLKPIDAEFQEAKNTQRVTDVRQNGSAAEARAAPLAVTAQAVVRAIVDAKPFPRDVKALESLGADAKLLQPLQAVAEGGAPSLKDLRAELGTLRDRLMGSAEPTPSGSYMDRLVAGATSLVRVRPLGSVVGDAPPAIVARMDAELANDDMAGALADWQKLPEPSRDLSKGLADRMRLRLAASTAAQTIAADAIGAMTSAQR